MQFGQIHRKSELERLFKDNTAIYEVYSSEDFGFSNNGVSFYLLLSGNLNTVKLIQDLYELYGEVVKIYVTREQLHPMFINKIIIWREGDWCI